MSDIALRVEGLSKQYRIGARKQAYRTLRDTLGESLSRPARRLRSAFGGPPIEKRVKHEQIWALEDISFTVRTGEVVGVIGRNGAGKSTLLKILSRITEPTRGYADIRGRVGSLLEVGTGFHPELTGEENIYLNGAILGMTRADIRRKFDEIVAFAEIDRFINTPVKHYSSGMYLRLAFAVAAHLEPEVLLVDEVLAVGDAGFQRKCTGKMGEVARDGRTVLFVSHNMAAMRQLCSSAFLLSGGRLAMSGETGDVIRAYLSSSLSTSAADLTTAERSGAGEIQFSSLRFEDEAGQGAPGLISGRPGRIVFSLSSQRSFPRVRACIGFLDNFNQRIMYLNSYFVREDFGEVAPDTELVCEIPRVSLSPGRYRIELWVQTSATTVQDRIADAGSVEVLEGNFFGTGKAMAEGAQLALMDYSWQLQAAPSAVAVRA